MHRVLLEDEIIRYCDEQDPIVRDEIICQAIHWSVATFPVYKHIFLLDLRSNLYVPVAKMNKDNLRTILTTFVSQGVRRFMQLPLFTAYAALHEKEIKTLLNGTCFSGNKLAIFEAKVMITAPVDLDPLGLHFLNGRLDLTSFNFGPRLSPFVNGMFITKAIDYEYITDQEKTTLVMQWLHGVMSDLFAEPSALEYFRYEVTKAIQCMPFIEGSNLLYLVGKRASGKTTVFNILRASFTDVYCKTINPQNAFRCSRDAIAAISNVESQTRLMLLDDPPVSAFSSCILKTLCDGVINGRNVFADDVVPCGANPKLIIAGHKSLSVDDTTIRSAGQHMLYYQLKNEFVGTNAEVGTNHRLQVNFQFAEMSPLDKTAILLYFCQHCRSRIPLPPRPRTFLSGMNVRNFSTFIKEMLIVCENQLLNVEQVIEGVGLYLPDFDFNRKEIIFALEKFTDEFGFRYLKDKQVASKKGFFLNLMANEANFERIRNSLPLLNDDGSPSETFVM
jgi:hypothetical protein